MWDMGRRHTECITVSHDESAVAAAESRHIPDSLKKHGRHVDGKVFGTLAVAEHVGIGHVGAVVLGAEVLSIPARGESDLRPDTVGAVRIDKGLVGDRVAVQGRLRISLVVEAVETHGALPQGFLRSKALAVPLVGRRIGLGKVPGRPASLIRVSGNHSKASREGRQVIQMELVVSEAKDLVRSCAELWMVGKSDAPNRNEWEMRLTYASIPPT